MCFDVAVTRRLGDRTISARFRSEARLTALTGPSGAGKTSILNMIAGLLRPDEGRIAVAGNTLFDSAEGVDLPPERRHAGYVFQDGRLFPHLRVRANLNYGHKLADPSRRRIDFEETIALLGMDSLLDRWPRTLSGGEAQRVALGRALLAGPDFLLMDEPLASVDLPRRHEIMTLIERIRDELKLPILYVSHERSEVERLTDGIFAVEELQDPIFALS